jgi:hypothetical protein
MAMQVMVIRPAAFLIALPIALPAFDLGLWTGWSMLTEADLCILVTLASCSSLPTAGCIIALASCIFLSFAACLAVVTCRVFPFSCAAVAAKVAASPPCRSETSSPCRPCQGRQCIYLRLAHAPRAC